MKLSKKQLQTIAKKYKLRILVLFGSQATEQTHKESDIDLAFISSKKINDEKLYQEICQILHREDIDLVNLAKTHNLYTRYEILSTGIALYEEKKGTHSTMRAHSFIDYTDFKHYFEERSKLLERKLAEMT